LIDATVGVTRVTDTTFISGKRAVASRDACAAVRVSMSTVVCAPVSVAQGGASRFRTC
jgi:hypothetical protein